MADQINCQPQVLNLLLYAGDGVKFRLVCTTGAGAPMDVTGAINAQIRLNRDYDGDPVEHFDVDMVDAYAGIVTLSMTGEDTKKLSLHASANGGKFTGVWDVQWTPNEREPITMCQGTVECVADVTRPEDPDEAP